MCKEIINIVLVDDYEPIRALLKELLMTQSDFRVVGEAESGDKVIELVKTLKPDILITDMMLTGKNGIEVTKLVHSRFPQIGIIVWSSLSTEVLALEALNAGAKGYIFKDCGIDVLITTVREVALGHYYLSLTLSMQALEAKRYKTLRKQMGKICAFQLPAISQYTNKPAILPPHTS